MIPTLSPLPHPVPEGLLLPIYLQLMPQPRGPCTSQAIGQWGWIGFYCSLPVPTLAEKTLLPGGIIWFSRGCSLPYPALGHMCVWGGVEGRVKRGQGLSCRLLNMLRGIT